VRILLGALDHDGLRHVDRRRLGRESCGGVGVLRLDGLCRLDDRRVPSGRHVIGRDRTGWVLTDGAVLD
jgi:hypothetical protein